MNILYITPTPPFPPTDGARLIVAQLARELSKDHTLYLAALTKGESVSPDLARYFAETRLVPRRVVPKWRKWAASFIDPMPLWARAVESNEMRGSLRTLLTTLKIDVVHLDTGPMALYLDCVAPVPTVLAPHDSLTLQLQHRIARAPDARERFVARFQLPKMRQYETAYYPRATRVCVVTRREQDFLQDLAPALAVRVIPNGVDSSYFSPTSTPVTPHSLAFLGVMDYVPNQAAVLFFVRDVLPRIWLELPDATFTIIGRNPARDICALARDPRIRVTGTVDDVRPLLAASSVIVCPMLEASGIKNKLLEALAMGKAIVAAPEAADGMDARDGTELILARGAQAFAACCVNLLRDDQARLRFGASARAWALRHSWTRTAAQYEALYQEAINAAPMH